MADGRRVRGRAQSCTSHGDAPTGPDVRLHSAGAQATTIDHAAREQKASSMHPSVQKEGRTATASSSHACMECVNSQTALFMARELLCDRPADAGYTAWLTRNTQLINTTGEALMPLVLSVPLHPMTTRRPKGDDAAPSRAWWPCRAPEARLTSRHH